MPPFRPIRSFEYISVPLEGGGGIPRAWKNPRVRCQLFLRLWLRYVLVSVPRARRSSGRPYVPLLSAGRTVAVRPKLYGNPYLVLVQFGVQHAVFFLFSL